MSEFKFACPVCGQHITADSATSGQPLECPTCFRKIVVPQPPADSESKFILSASQVAKPRPLPTEAGLEPIRAPTKGFPVVTVILLVLLLGAIASAIVFKDRIFPGSRAQIVTNPPPRIPPPKPASPVSQRPIPTNVVWTLELARASIPDQTATGVIRGNGFLCERTVLEAGKLTLRQGPGWPPDLGFTVQMYAHQAEELAGKTIEVSPDRTPPVPRIILRWKDADQKAVTRNFNSGYALRVIFGHPASNRMPGRIFISLPDEEKSVVAGTFNAEIRRPPPPKPRPPRPAGAP